jgi:hypothetical protein
LAWCQWGSISAGALLCRQLQLRRREVVRQLLVGARADHDRAHAGPAEQPGKRDLRGRYVMQGADLDGRLDHVERLLLVAYRRLVPVGQVP